MLHIFKNSYVCIILKTVMFISILTFLVHMYIVVIISVLCAAEHLKYR